MFGNKGAARPDLVLFKVKYDRLQLTIVERGTLESAHNSDIVCRVKTAANPPKIKSVIEDGTEVLCNRPVSEARLIYFWDEASGSYKSRDGETEDGPVVVEVDKAKGEKQYADLLLDLEDSALRDQLNTQKTTLDQAELNKFIAEETLNDQDKQNKADIAKATTDLENARFALMKYTGMTRDEVLRPQTIGSLKADMAKLAANFGRNANELAQEDLANFKAGDYLALVKDCMGQIENSKSDLSQQEDREAWAYRMAKKGYQTASQAQAETSRKESYVLALNKLNLNLENLVKSQKLKDLNQFFGDLEKAEQLLERTIAHAASLTAQNQKQAQIKKSNWEQEQTHYQDILKEIKMCKIYAPQDGIVVYYVPEQARMGGGSQQSIVAQGEPVREGQKLMQIPDLKNMVVNTKIHEALISRVHPGQKAMVRVDSFGNRTMRAKIEFKANLASQTDFFSSDVKIYMTRVAIEPDDIGGLELKPGMSAQVTITIANALDHVLTVPIQAIVGGANEKDEREVVVMTPTGPQKRRVTIGLSNGKMAEVKEGLQEGDEVVENPKAVLGDKIIVHEAGSDKGGDEGSKGGKAKGKDGKGKAKMEARPS